MDCSQENFAEALLARAASQPDAPLLHVPGRPAVTYRDLGEQIGHVRERLRDWGIVQGDVVAGCIDSRPHMALACAAFPSSSTFAPLSPVLTVDAYASLLERLCPRAVLVEGALDHPLRIAAARLGIGEVHIAQDPVAAFGRFVLDRPAASTGRHRNNRSCAEAAFVLVTSGTTGRAKLVPVGHRQMLLFARMLTEWLQLTPDDIGCSLSPFHLAGGLRVALLIPALGGGSVICLPEADVDGFFGAIDEFHPTYLCAGFAIHRTILRRSAAFRDQIARSRLRFLRTTSGRLELSEIDELEKIFDAPVVVSFGSTEACGIAHDPLPPRLRKRGAVGIPTVNEVAVIDASGRFRPQGSAGEIVVRGPLVCDGYFDDPDGTVRSFVGNWFRTGDLGRIDDDGYVFLSGRINEMINRGGEKISPMEIDSALESLPGIAEAAAFGVPHPSLGEELVAAVVREAGATIDETDIIARVRERMGSRHVPRRIYFVDRLPRTDLGKVRRNALAQSFVSELRTAASGDAAVAESAALPAEAALSRLWSTILGAGVIGRHDDFFLVGGDSVSGTQLLARVKMIFGVELPIKALFGEAATIAGMARAIESGRAPAPRALAGFRDASPTLALDGRIPVRRGR